MGEVVGYKPAEDVFQVIYDDEASRIARAQGLAPEVRCLPWRCCCQLPRPWDSTLPPPLQVFDEKLDEMWLVEDTGPKRVLRDRERIPRTAAAPPAPAPAPAPAVSKPGGTMTPCGLPRIKLGSKARKCVCER